MFSVQFISITALLDEAVGWSP